MSIRKKLALVTLLVVFVTSLLLGSVLVACDKDYNYSIYVKSINGLGIANVTVTVTNNGEQIANGTTDKNGLFTFDAKEGVYDVTVTNLPLGYKLIDSDYRISSDNTTLTILALSDDDYSIYVKSLGGLALANVSVAVTKNGTAIASGETDKKGLFVFDADKDEYDVTISNLPLGYTLTESSYKTSKDNNTLTIKASSAVIKDEIPYGKVYSLGDVSYDFSITDLTNANDPKVYTLSEVLAEKRMVLLNFWNTGCQPCKSEMPSMELAYREYTDKAELFAIDVSGFTGTDNDAAVRKFKKESIYVDTEGNTFGLTFPVSLDDLDKNNMARHYAFDGIPTSVVIDRYGVIAYIHTGGMDISQFKSLFEKYTSDNYTQDQVGGGNNGGDGDELERVKPNVSMPASSVIEAAINGSNFNGSYRPETEAEDAEYSWPWLVGETNGEKYIYPANSGVNYSFATIYTSVTITSSDITNKGNVVLAFDLQWSCENWCDYLFVIINNAYVYSYTGTDQWGSWQTCYALVASEPGTYNMALMYYKDPLQAEGFDTVRIRNMRMMSIPTLNNSTPSLDMPRNAALWTTASQYQYVTAVKDSDGFYHKDSETGPYILADLTNTTPFNKRLESPWGINQFATNGDFNYNTVGEDDPQYKPELDDTNAISLWAMAATNSELDGLTVVNDTLIELLNRFIKKQLGEDKFEEKMWLELCLYFDHYGYDKNDKGICDMARNPVRGLMNITAIHSVQAYEGELDLNNIPDAYKNNVFFDKPLMPRGLMYLFVPQVSGVYRFRTQSNGIDTLGWLYTFDGAVTHSSSEEDASLVSTDMELENPDKTCNLVLTYYLEAGQKYIFISCFADTSAFGRGYTFTVEHLGEEAYAWQYAGRGYVSFIEDENGGVSQLVSYHNVEFAIGEDGYVYVAKRDANGDYEKVDGNYVPDYSDPLYVDFTSGARLFEKGSLKAVIDRAEMPNLLATLSTKLAELWKVTSSKPENGWTESTTLQSIKGSALTATNWTDLTVKLTEWYGDSVYVTGKDITAELRQCTTIGELATFLKKYYLDMFNMTQIRFEAKYGIAESMYKDYTSLVKSACQAALENEGDPTHGNEDRGCVKLTVQLIDALNMFCKRLNGNPELDTEWLRLCAHYQHFGPNN